MSALPRPKDPFVFHTLALESDHMTAFNDWFPLAMAGLTFTILGSIKLWGLTQGIVDRRRC